MLAGADILIQPHNPAYYATQTSGVFAEARAFGVVAVVPAGTWMAQEIEQRGGGVIVEDQTAAAYTDAIRLGVAQLKRLKEEARRAARAWHELNSPAGFVAALNSILPRSHVI